MGGEQPGARVDGLAHRPEEDERKTGPAFRDVPGQLYPVHPGHLQVDEGQLEACVSLQQAQRLGTGGGGRRLHPPALGLPGQVAKARGIVVYQEHAPPGQVLHPVLRPVLHDCLWRAAVVAGGLRVDGEVEGRPLVRHAFHPDGAAHGFHEPPGDGQPQPRAAVAAAGGSIHLAERLEEPVQPVRRDADAGVPYAEVEQRRPPGRPSLRERHDHLPGFGELDGVGEQVHQHLAHARHVADDGVRDVCLHQTGEFEPPGGGVQRDEVECLFDAAAHVERMAFEFEVAGFDLREVQNVVDEREERVAGRADDLRELALLGVEVRLQQQARHPDHPVERRADLVAHAGQELALGERGRLGRVPRAFELVHRVAQLTGAGFYLLGQVGFDLFLHQELVVEEDREQRDREDDERRQRDADGQPDLARCFRGRMVEARSMRVLGGGHAGVVHAADGEPHDEGRPELVAEMILLARSELEGDPERRRSGRHGQHDGCGEEQRVVADDGFHPHRRHAGVVHPCDARAHDDPAQEKRPAPDLRPRPHVKGEAGGADPYHHGEQGDRDVVRERHLHAEGQHPDEVHGPDADPHRDAAGDQPAQRVPAPAVRHPPGQRQRRERGQHRDDVRQ